MLPFDLQDGVLEAISLQALGQVINTHFHTYHIAYQNGHKNTSIAIIYYEYGSFCLCTSAKIHKYHNTSRLK